MASSLANRLNGGRPSSATIPSANEAADQGGERPTTPVTPAIR